MASPVVAATTENSVVTASTTHAITLPAGGAATDEYIIVLSKGTPATTATFNALTDWTELLDENVSLGLTIWVYDGAGVPSNPTFTSSAAIRSASIAFRITGADKGVAPQVGTTGTGTSATPDPPASATPPSSKDYLFIAFAGMAGEEADDDTWGNTPPTNYLPSPPLQKACGTAGTNLAGLVLAASRELTTGSAENPGTFGVDVSAAWRAQTITVHPAILVSGGVASEADAGATGQAKQIYTANPAASSESSPTGQAAQIYTAAPAASNESVPAGTVDQGGGQTVSGGVASEADSVPSGQVAQIYTTSPASESNSSTAGQVQQVYTASPAAEGDSVPAGTVNQGGPQTINGGIANENNVLPSGKVLQTYTASPASDSESVPSGQARQTYTASPATESNTAPGGVFIQTIFGGVAQESDSVPSGQVVTPTVVFGGVAAEADSVPSGTAPPPILRYPALTVPGSPSLTSPPEPPLHE